MTNASERPRGEHQAARHRTLEAERRCHVPEGGFQQIRWGCCLLAAPLNSERDRQHVVPPTYELSPIG
jgi:hypothetical protein